MGTVIIEGYLVQGKLEDALRMIVGNDCWRGREIRLPVGRRRWDMSYDIDGKVAVVEFDGDEHYRNTLKIKADREKDVIAREHSFRVVRIPYWVQLTSETLKYYFNLDAEIRQDFPHGFISTKIFPASFCPLGIQRFERELQALPMQVRQAVVKSLHDRSIEHGQKYVVPMELMHLL